MVIFDFTDTAYMDDSASLVIEELIDTAAAERTECIVIGLSGQPALTPARAQLPEADPDDHFADDVDGAREVAARLLGLDKATTE